jgi:hypothetical protein
MLPSIDRGDGLFEVLIDAETVSVSRSEVLLSLGYANENIDGHFDELIEKILLQLPELCTVSAGFRQGVLHTVDGRHDGVYINEMFLEPQKIIVSQLRGAQSAALFIGTIGKGMEERVRELFAAGEAVEGHFTDTIASLAAEKVAGLLHNHIGAVMQSKGLLITNRYSPGYCGWPVSEQQKLFAFFPERFCGVTLTESSLMTPVKSVSGIIGIGASVTRAPYLCGRCGQKNCTYRAYNEARGMHGRSAPAL